LASHRHNRSLRDLLRCGRPCHCRAGRSGWGHEVRSAAAEFLSAVAVPDVDAARARFAGDETQVRFLDAHFRFANSYDGLRQSIAKHFGPSPRTTGASFLGDRAAASKHQYVVLNGEIASLGSGGFLDPGLRLRRVGGVWKVTHLAARRWQQGQFARLLGAFADACDSVRGRVEAGTVASSDATWQGLDEPIRLAIRDGAPLVAARLGPAPELGGQKPTDVPKVEAFEANFGQPIESEAMRRLIGALPGAPALSDGQFWRLASDEAGVEMAFQGDDKRLAGVFLYEPGAYLTDGYPGAFPLGLAAGATRRDVERRLGPDRKSVV